MNDNKYKELVNEALEDLKTKGRRHRQIPNILTLMRLTAPLFIIPTAIVGNLPLLLGMTAVFSLTDLVDGLIARKFNLTSELGKNLDAVTDKIFASTLLISASFTSPFLLINLIVEGIIAAINISKELNNEEVQSTIIGKVKTWFLFSLVGIGLIKPYFQIDKLFDLFYGATAIMQVLTVTSYLNFENIRSISKKSKKIDISPANFNVIDEVKKRQKEKILEDNYFNLNDKLKENSELAQLEMMKEILLSYQDFMESKCDDVNNSINYQKSKNDDFRTFNK